MLINRPPDIKPSEITPESAFHRRRDILKAALAAGLLPAANVWGQAIGGGLSEPMPLADGAPRGRAFPEDGNLGELQPWPNDVERETTSFEDITNYNNYYEFSTDKQAVARLAEGYPTSPWTVEIGGLVNNPGTYDVDDLKQMFDIEERIYRLRCVEAWSMVIPWMGFQLSDLLEVIEPTSEAKYVRMETILDMEGMPGQRSSSWYQWPYVEGLRIDEAMNPLAILATGLYGKDLLPQNGAPIRLVVPWKYGFKSVKSIVKLDLVAEQPTSLWMAAAGHEYGFYANVNPQVNHPRWSQATERRIGERGRRETLMFNGYEEQVAYLYEGMDLVANY